MKTYYEFAREYPLPYLGQEGARILRREYEEYCAEERERQAAESASRYLDPYNAATGLFLEYEMGYAGAER
jgi:hypothetical protein